MAETTVQVPVKSIEDELEYRVRTVLARVRMAEKHDEPTCPPPATHLGEGPDQDCPKHGDRFHVATPPSIEDMAPGTTFTAEFKESGRRTLFVKVGGTTAWPLLAVEWGALATYTEYAIDPSTIRDVRASKGSADG